jgi:hypothetical protein
MTNSKNNPIYVPRRGKQKEDYYGKMAKRERRGGNDAYFVVLSSGWGMSLPMRYNHSISSFLDHLRYRPGFALKRIPG